MFFENGKWKMENYYDLNEKKKQCWKDQTINIDAYWFWVPDTRHIVFIYMTKTSFYLQWYIHIEFSRVMCTRSVLFFSLFSMREIRKWRKTERILLFNDKLILVVLDSFFLEISLFYMMTITTFTIFAFCMYA